MKPSLAGLDARYGGLTDAVNSREFDLSSGVLLDFERLLLGELCKVTSFSSRLCSMSDLVSLIQLRRLPLKVIKPRVASYAIKVGALIALWCRPSKGSNDEKVNEETLPLRALQKSYLQVSLVARTGIGRHDPFLYDPGSSEVPGLASPLIAANSSKAANGVMPFVAADGEPFFLNHKESFL